MSRTDGAPRLLHAFFTRAARRWPHHVAVDVPPGPHRPERRRLTYQELDRQSDALTHRVREAVDGECVVAILLPRTSAHLYAAQLAVLKAGAAYTCLDPSFPDDRVLETLDDATPALMLTDHAGRSRSIAAGLPAGRIVDVVEFLHAHPAAEPLPAPPWLTPESLAYVIYTSGTTGRPKGVMIEHRSIANLVASDLETFRLPGDARVVQNSSPAYDSSVEELWLAFAAGATVLVMDEAATRLGPDLVPWLAKERATVFCPPPTLLRASGCEDPIVALPELRLLYVGGEALPQDVADRWAPGRTLVNGYGPTECSVTALRAEVRAGQPVTIGWPVPDVQAHVLDEALNPVPDGAEGELCLGGIALARGYWNQEELTERRFPHHPALGRLYRTGDVVVRGPDGAFLYYGRRDAQVKLRGYRIELGAVESALAALSGVREAACTVQDDDGRQALVAFVVPDDGASPPLGADLLGALRTRLPDYMVPSRIGTLEVLPTSVGGKLDRRALPRLDAARPAAEGGNGRVTPRSVLEERIEAAMRDVLRRTDGVGVHDDFFTHLGGDSLGAAELITVLRDDPATAALTVRDVYEARTIEALAARAGNGAAMAAAVVVPEAAAFEDRRIGPATVAQALWIFKRLVVGSSIAWAFAFHVVPALAGALGLTRLLLFGPLLVLLALATYVPLSVVLAVLAKRTLIGRYRPMRASVWSAFHLRNWIVQQAVKSVPWWLIEGTEFHHTALRALGARIGRRVHLHRGVNLRQGGWDLLAIGDDVSIGQDAALRLVDLEGGHIVIGAVTIADEATLEVHAGVGGDCVLERGAYLSARSALPRGGRIPAGERWDGIPARPAGAAPAPPPLPAGTRELPPAAAGLLLIGARLVLAASLALPTALLAAATALAYHVDAARTMAWLYSTSLDARVLAAWALLAAASVPLALAMEALACRLMGRVEPGVTSRWSAGYARIWLKPLLVDSAGRWLYGTLFWPWWLRLAGMKVGPGCEISGLIDTVPETVAIGAKTFCADGIYLAGPLVHRGTVTVRPVVLSANTFLGNGVVIAGGQRLPDDILLGVCTVADEQAIRPGTAWFGHPPFELPHREVVAYDPQFTYDPSAWRVAARVFWELLRFAVPTVPALVVACWFKWLVAEETHSWAYLLLVTVPIASIGAAALFTLLIIVIKWSLLGRVRPGIHPLWSSWASRWDLVCLAWNIYAADVVSAFDGTLMLNVLLRGMGVHIGRRVVLGAGFAEDLPDPDMLTFEDDATVDCLFQAHTFEDRVLKLDRVRVRRGASVGRNAVLLYGADVGERTRVTPHSVVMKHEHLLADRTYAGFPTRPQADATSW